MRVQLNRILVTTDFSPFSNRAVSVGIALAKAFDAQLYLCHVIDLTASGMYGEAFLAFEEQQQVITRRATQEMQALMTDQSVGWEPLITGGHPADEILRYTKDYGIDLVVSATHGRSGLKRFIIGSVTGRLMRTLPCPLLIVQSREESGKALPSPTFHPKRILVGCDFSPDSDYAFQYSVSLGQEFQSELHMVHVMEPSVYKDLLTPASPLLEELRDSLQTTLKEKLEAMVPEEAFTWCTLKPSLLTGEPQDELITYAKEHAIDLIVLGTRGHNLMETLFIGSTTVRVASRAPCPVLSVSPRDNEG